MKLKIYIYCMLFIVLLLCYCQIDVFETHSPPADLVKIRGYVTSESVLLDSVKITYIFFLTARLQPILIRKVTIR